MKHMRLWCVAGGGITERGGGTFEDIILEGLRRHEEHALVGCCPQSRPTICGSSPCQLLDRFLYQTIECISLAPT